MVLILSLAPGLVSVVGPRGTGKTSLIELLRFGLDVRRLTATDDPYRHARAILDTGQVTLTVEVGGEDIRLVRSSGDAAPRGGERIGGSLPLILAQNEIEELGEDPRDQMALIDGFRAREAVDEAEETRLRAVVSSLTRDVRDATTDIAALRDQLAGLGDLTAANEEVRSLEAQLGAGTADAKPLRDSLDELTQRVSATNVANDLLGRNRFGYAEVAR